MSGSTDATAAALAPQLLRGGVKLQAGAAVKISVVGKSGRPRNAGRAPRPVDPYRPEVPAAAANTDGGAAASSTGGDEGELGEAQWLLAEGKTSEFAHGERVSMKVEAAGLDGRTIRFVVEHRASDRWEKLAETSVAASGGEANAQLQLHHPLPAIDAAALDIQFYAELA